MRENEKTRKTKQNKIIIIKKKKH